MTKTQKIGLQQDLILSTLDALKVLAVSIASGSQEESFAAVAQIGLKASYIADAIATRDYEGAVVAFSTTQEDIMAEAQAREEAEGGCAGCSSGTETETPDLSREDLEGMLNTLHGMMGKLGVTVSK